MNQDTINIFLTIIFILAFTSILGFHIALHYRKRNKINYSNYQNCLIALAESDPELVKYISHNKTLNRRA